MATDFEDMERDEGGGAVREALRRARRVGPEAPPPIDADPNEPERTSFTALPFEWRDPTKIPRRQFLYGFELRRKQLSAVIAPGAAGKTTFKIGRAICMAAGRELLGHRVWNGPHRVWLWNLEDDMEEVEKTVHAFLKLWDLTHLDLGGRLFINGADSVGSSGLKLAVEDNYGGFKLQRPVAEALIAELTDREIDYLDIDPFVSSHSVDENSNQAIDAVSKEWLRIGHEANPRNGGVAIGLAHHLRKATGIEFTSGDARGAGAMVNAARSVLVLQRMSTEDAAKLQVAPADRKSYFSLYDDKNNKAPPAAKAEWYKFVSVGLDNGDSTGPEDSIGAIERWHPTDAFANISVRQLYDVQKAIAERPDDARYSPTATRWVGRLVAEVLELNVDNKLDHARIKEMLNAWLANGALRTAHWNTEKREPAPYVIVGKWAEIG